METNTDFHRTISTTGFGLNKAAHLVLATANSTKYLNLVTNSTHNCLSAKDAKLLRDELNRIYPIEAPAPAPVVPKTAPALKVGGYVRLLNHGYGGVEGVTYEITKVEPMYGRDWVWIKSLIGTPIRGNSSDGSFPIEHFEAVERPRKARYIVASTDFDGTLSPSRNPFLHSTQDEALTEAQRLAKAHGGEFRVLKEVAAASRPAVVIPPVEVRAI